MIYLGYKFTSHRFLEQWETREAQIVRRTIGKTTVGRKEYIFTALQTLLRFSHSPCESSFHVLTVKEISVCFQITIKQLLTHKGLVVRHSFLTFHFKKHNLIISLLVY